MFHNIILSTFPRMSIFTDTLLLLIPRSIVISVIQALERQRMSPLKQYDTLAELLAGSSRCLIVCRRSPPPWTMA